MAFPIYERSYATTPRLATPLCFLPSLIGGNVRGNSQKALKNRRARLVLKHRYAQVVGDCYIYAPRS